MIFATINITIYDYCHLSYFMFLVCFLIVFLLKILKYPLKIITKKNNFTQIHDFGCEDEKREDGVWNGDDCDVE